MAQPTPIDRQLVGWMSLTQLISWGSVFYLFALLIAPVEEALGMSRAQTSLAFSLAMLLEGFIAYPIGRWIDKGHERAVMTLGSLWLALCLLLLSRVTTASGFYLVWAGLGAGMAATLYAPAFAVVTRRYPGDFRRAIITLTFLGGLASTVFIPLTSWLINHLGWRHALWCLAALHLLVCAPVHAKWLKGAPRRPAPNRQTQTTEIVHSAQEVAGNSLTQHLRSPPFALIGVFVVLMMAVTAALPAHMVSLLRENGLSETWAIAIPASIGAIQVLGRILLYFFEHHFDLHLANRLIPCLIPIGLMALLAAPLVDQAHIGLLLVFVAFFGMGNGMLTIVKGTAIAEYVDREHVAALNGALGMPLALARAGAPLALGLLWTQQAGYAHGLWLMLGLSLVAIGAMVTAQRLAATRLR